MGVKNNRVRKNHPYSKTTSIAKKFEIKKEKSRIEVASTSPFKPVRFGKNRLIISPYNDIEMENVFFKPSRKNVIKHDRTPRLVRFIGEMVQG